MKKIKVNYLGVTGNENYGDDCGKKIIENLGFKHDENSNILLIGAGTLFPISKDLRKQIKNEPKEVIVFGSGCWTKEFYNLGDFDEDLEYSKNLLKKAKFIGLRDEHTREMLGVGEVTGDPFFSSKYKFEYDYEDIDKDYILFCPGRASFNCWGGVDGEMDSLKNTLKFLKSTGKEIKIITP